jgi:hypothetical protein
MRRHVQGHLASPSSEPGVLEWGEHESSRERDERTEDGLEVWKGLLVRDIGDPRWGTGGSPVRNGPRPSGTRSASVPEGGHDDAW